MAKLKAIDLSLQQDLRDCIKRLNGLSTGFKALEYKNAHKIVNVKSGLNIAKRNLPKIGLSVQDVNNLNIIHVAGTKGKGSTSAYTESILRNFGCKTGLYTSPHLMSVRERIRICGQPLSPTRYVKYFNYVWEKLSTDLDPELGYFQFNTLLSYYAFKEEGTEVCIYETGIGGEFDATNVVSQPVATGITTLGIDHPQTLGQGPLNSLSENIAWHKSGIFKRGCQAFTTLQSPEFIGVLQRRALEIGAPLRMVDIHPSIQNDDSGCFSTNVQKYNATLAVELANTYRQKVLNIEVLQDQVSDAVLHGLRQCQWDGRLQIINMGIYNWYLDGAHNIASIRVAGHWFSDVQSTTSSVPRILIFNQQEQKRGGETLLKELHNILTMRGIRIDHAIFTTDLVWKDGTVIEDLVNNNVNPDIISSLHVQKSYAEFWRTLDSESKATTAGSIEEAMTHAQKIGTANGMQTLITGSLHVVGGALFVMRC